MRQTVTTRQDFLPNTVLLAKRGFVGGTAEILLLQSMRGSEKTPDNGPLISPNWQSDPLMLAASFLFSN